MTQHYFGATDIGRMRDGNEDAFIAETVWEGRFIMAAVIDGVGGYDGGEVAAAITREAFLNYFSVPSGDVSTMLKEAFVAANEKIFAEKQRTRKYPHMACVATLAMVDITNKEFFYAHVGDTRLYLLRGDTLVKVTKDHSFVGFLEDSGRLTEESAMNHPKRNEIDKGLGFNDHINRDATYVETGSSPFLPGDILLLCSDGLSDLVNRYEMVSILETELSIEEKAKALIDAANEKGGKDNITVVLVANTSKPIKQRATKPAAPKKKESEKSEAGVENEAALEVIATTRQKKNVGVFILSTLCFLLVVALVWALWRQPKKEEMSAPVVVQNNLSASQQKLMDTLMHLQGNVLHLTDSIFTQPLIIGDTLLIQKDSLVLEAKPGFVIKCDSLYKGPALLIAPSCRYIMLKNITFQNFSIGIQTSNASLHLQQVVFNHCSLPLSRSYLFKENSFISGHFSDSNFFKSDSLFH